MTVSDQMIARGLAGGQGPHQNFLGKSPVPSSPPKWYDYQMDVRSANGSRHGYAVPSGALTFLNERASGYLGLPKDRPLRFRIDTGAAWDSHIPLLHPDDHEETRRLWSICLRTGCAGQVNFRVRNAEGGCRRFLSRAEPVRTMEIYCIGSGSISILRIGNKQSSTSRKDSGSLTWVAVTPFRAYLRRQS